MAASGSSAHIKTSSDRLNLAMRVLTRMTGLAVCNHSTGVSEAHIPSLSYGYAVQLDWTTHAVRVRAFARGNRTKGVVPNLLWQIKMLTVLSNAIYDVVFLETEIQNDTKSAWIDLTDEMLLTLDRVNDLEYDLAHVKWPNFLSPDPEDKKIASSDAQDDVTMQHQYVPATGDVTVPETEWNRLCDEDDDVHKGREATPGPLPYAKAYERLHRAIIALRESVGR